MVELTKIKIAAAKLSVIFDNPTKNFVTQNSNVQETLMT